MCDSVALVDEARCIHLACTEPPSELVLQFGKSNNREGSVPLIACSTSVEEDDSNWIIETGSATTCSASDLCGAPANQTDAGHFINPGYIHTILITSLLPDTVYYYKLHTNVTSWSPIYSFTSPPPSPQDLLDKHDYSIQFIGKILIIIGFFLSLFFTHIKKTLTI